MKPSQTINQLVLATVSGTQAGELINRLNRDRFYVTKIDSSGGLLYEATVLLLIGLDGIRLSHLLEHIRECCPTRRQFVPAHAETPFFAAQPVMIEAEIGGATIYVFDVERFEQI